MLSFPQIAPSLEEFPAYPKSWYLFGTSEELKRARKGVVGKDMLGRRIAVFRSSTGKLKALDAVCSHLGADLSRGNIVGDSLRCPYHGWEYGTDGRCSRIPGTDAIPGKARQTVFAVEERHGLIFIFNGQDALFPLPFFNGEIPDQFVAGRSFQFTANCSWFLLASHSFDTQHFESVHDRRLLAPPEVDCPAKFARRNRYSAEVSGDSIFDKALRTFAGKTVNISITTWGGTLFFLTGTFRRAASCFMITSQPVGPDKCLVHGVCFARRNGSFINDKIVVPTILALRRIFTQGYLLHESELLGEPKYQQWALGDVDKELLDYFRWQVNLESSAPKRAGAEAADATQKAQPARQDLQDLRLHEEKLKRAAGNAVAESLSPSPRPT